MIVILGASASGKSTLAKDLINSSPEYRRIVTYTTRPMRPGEQQDVDYHFISEDKFREMINDGEFAEYNVYREWYYGTALEDCVNNNHVVAVLTPAGLRCLRKCGVKTLAVYLYVDRMHRLVNSLQRGDNVDEAYRRNLSDVGQFDGVEDEVDAIIDNADFSIDRSDVLNTLYQIIDAYEAGELD